MPRTTILLVRHGETTDNRNRIMQGQTQGELSEEGVRQARELAKRLQGTTIDAFLTSDLKRAKDTCRILAKGRGVTVETTKLLRERDWGSFTGRYIPDLKDEPWPQDIETIAAMRLRAEAFLSLVRRKYEGKTVLAVGHGITNKVIQAVHYQVSEKEIQRMENAEVRTLLLP